MIEIIIKDKKLYDLMKSKATYASDYTRVCEFDDSMYQELLDKGILSTEFEFEEKEPYISIAKGNIMIMVNPTLELKMLLDLPESGTIKNMYFEQIFHLIKSGAVGYDSSFAKSYSKIPFKTQIKDLVSANLNIKNTKMSQVYPEETFGSVYFPRNEETLPVKPEKRRMTELIITSDLLKKEGYKSIVKCKNKSDQNVLIELFGPIAVTQNSRNLLKQGKTIFVAYTSMSKVAGAFKISNPEFYPREMKNYDFGNTLNYIVGHKRSVNSLAWKTVYWEFMTRYKLVDERKAINAD